MARNISIFCTLNSAGNSSDLTYGTNSGGARLFEGYFVKHLLDTSNRTMSRYQASGKIVGMAIHGESTNQSHTIQVAIRQGSAANASNTLWDMSAGSITGAFGADSSAGLGLVLRCSDTSAAALNKGVVPIPPYGIPFEVNTDANKSNHEDLYIFAAASNSAVGSCTVRVDIELEHGVGSIKPHKRALFKGTSAGVLY